MPPCDFVYSGLDFDRFEGHRQEVRNRWGIQLFKRENPIVSEHIFSVEEFGKTASNVPFCEQLHMLYKVISSLGIFFFQLNTRK